MCSDVSCGVTTFASKHIRVAAVIRRRTIPTQYEALHARTGGHKHGRLSEYVRTHELAHNSVSIDL